MLLDILQLKDIEDILFFFSQQDENAHKIGIQQFLLAFDVLNIVNDLDFKEGVRPKLPRRTINGFDLNRDGVTANISRHEVEQGNVSSKWGRYISQATEFCRDEMFTDLPCELSVAPRCHYRRYSQRLTQS